MPTASEVTVRPERLVAGGDALARDAGGRVVFVHGALPGELVRVAVTDAKRDWARGDVIEVVEAAAERATPPCEYRRAGCGGCDWQHVAPAAQLAAKASIVVDALRRTAKLPDAAVAEGASVPCRAYRTTVRVVGTAARRAGFRRERSHAAITVAECMVADPALFDVLGDAEIDPGVELTLRVSAATRDMTARWDRRRGGVRGLPDAVRTGPGAALHEDVAGHRLQVSAGSFFQSGPDAAGLLVDAVRRAAPELTTAAHVVDAYAGVGIFGVAATPASCRITALETSRPSSRDAVVNLADRVATVVRGEVGEWVAGDERVDVVVADPARSGLGTAGAAALAAARAPVLVLVSCDPVALARDASLLERLGYRHERTEVVDLFPMTHHVETVTRFAG